MEKEAEEILSIIRKHAKPTQKSGEQCVVIQTVQNLYLTIEVKSVEMAEAAVEKLRSLLPR